MKRVKALGSEYTAEVESNGWTFLIDSGLGKRSRGTVQGMYLNDRARAYAMPWVCLPALGKEEQAEKNSGVSL